MGHLPLTDSVNGGLYLAHIDRCGWLTGNPQVILHRACKVWFAVTSPFCSNSGGRRTGRRAIRSSSETKLRAGLSGSTRTTIRGCHWQVTVNQNSDATRSAARPQSFSETLRLSAKGERQNLSWSNQQSLRMKQQMSCPIQQRISSRCP